MRKHSCFIKGILAVCLGAMLLVGCGADSRSRSREVRIGLALYDEHDTYIAELTEEFMTDVAEVNTQEPGTTVSVLTYSANQSQITQNAYTK